MAAFRFESLPPEIRIMIYGFLFTPIRFHKECSEPSFIWNLGRPYHYTHILRTRYSGDSEILRSNRNINREASVVFYRNVLLVSIDWDTSDWSYLSLVKMPKGVGFNFVVSGAPLPPCVVRIQQKFHDDNESNDRISTVVLATDFPAICRQLLTPLRDSTLKSGLFENLNRYDKARTSYSVLSLPETGYDVNRLKELVWLPLLTLRTGHLEGREERTHRNLRSIDCTGVSEQTSAALDWESEVDDEDKTVEDDGSKDTDNDGYGSETNTISGVEGYAQDNYKKGSGEEKSRKDEDRHEKDIHEDCNNKEDSAKMDHEQDRGY